MAQDTATIKINGMTCKHCVFAVKSALEESEEIFNAEVSLENESAIVTYDPDGITTVEIADIIEKEGYTPSQ